MRNLFTIATLVLIGVSASAANYNPEVAYVQVSGGYNNIYLANQDGTNAVKVFSSTKSVSGVDIAPSGGRVVFTDLITLKVLNYSVSASGITVNSVVTLDTKAEKPDFSPDGSQIIYIGVSPTGASEIRLISAAGGMPKVILGAFNSLIEVAWMRTGDKFAYYRRNWDTNKHEAYLATLDANDDVVSNDMLFSADGQAFSDISGLDTARTRNSLLLSGSFSGTYRLFEYNIDTNSFQNYAVGGRGHFSSDDSKIVYTENTNYYVSRYTISSGATSRLTKRGSFGHCDWRP